MDTNLNIRTIDADAVARLKRAAAVRDLTIGRYIERLIALHDVARQHADADPSDSLQAELQALGLETKKN